MPKEQYILPDIGDPRNFVLELQRILDIIAQRLNYMDADGDDIKFNGKKITDLAVGSANSDAVRKDQIFLLADLASVILGTLNQITVTDNGNETITLSTPQDIDTDADVTFDSLTIDYIDLNLSSTTANAEGRLKWNDDDGALDIGMPGGNVVAQIPLEDLTKVVNKSGSDIANGKFVYVTGSQGNILTIDLADNTDADKIFILGMATETINNNANGYIATRGKVRGSAAEPINTSGTVEGDKLYLNTSGGFTKTHPTNSAHAVIVCGRVVKAHATDGIIELTTPQMFTIGNNFNGILRQSVINKNTGNAAGAGFTAVNDNGYFTTIGIAGSGNVTFPNNVSIHYVPGYGDHWQAIDGNKDYVWFSDPTDSHNNSALTNEIMRLLASGYLGINTNAPSEQLEVGSRVSNTGGVLSLKNADTTINTNDPIGTIYFKGVDSGLRVGAKIIAQGSEVWGSDLTDAPTQLEFYTQSDGVADGLASARMIITDEGYFEFPDDMVVVCPANKTIELQTVVYEDIQFSISGGRVPAANFPTFSTFTANTKEYQFDVNDFLYLNANEYAHAFKNLSSWSFHLHATTDSANASGSSQYAKFTLYVAYADTGDTWTETSVTAELEIPDGTSALEAFFLTLGTVSPSKNIGTQIKLTIERIAATGGTEYPDEIFLTQVGLHGEVNTLGSRQIGTK